MEPPLGAGAAPRLFGRAHRRVRPPTPWTWAIHQEGQAEPCRCSTRFCRSADEVWAVCHAPLERVGKPLPMTVPGPDEPARVAAPPGRARGSPRRTLAAGLPRDWGQAAA